MIPASSLAPAERSKSLLAASLLLLAGVVCSVVLGPQLAVWPSGPALVCLTLSCLLLLPALGNPSLSPLPKPVLATGLLFIFWILGRAASSPVAEFAVADAALLAACVAGFLITRCLLAIRGATEILFTGLGVLVLANWIPMLIQSRDSSFAPILPRGTENFPSGFFAYYGDCASFLLGVSLLAGGLAWDARRAKAFRVFMAIVAMAGAAGVMFTRSRGGIVGLGAGAAVLLILAPWLTARKGSARLGIFALALPVVLIGGMLFLGSGMEEAQRARGQDGDTGALLDNSARFLWGSIALSCIATHPWQGGGSRSFSWESYRFWDAQAAGFSPAKPEFAHNELMQISTDYGIIGLLLLVGFLGAAVICAIVGRWSGSSAKAGTAMFVGGLAALTGLLVHGCLHFVFHLPPSALLLGVVLAMLLETTRRDPATKSTASKIGAAIPVVFTATLAGFIGFKSMTVFGELAPVKYRLGSDLSPADATTRLEEAAKRWPSAQLHLQRGLILQAQAGRAAGLESRMQLEAAAAGLEEAMALHPFHPDASVNLANVLSVLGREADAEQEFERAIRLQGGMEIGFHARYSASLHHYRKAERQRKAGQTDAALLSLLKARDLYDAALSSPESNELGDEGRNYRMALSQQLGTWLQALGRHEDAADEYDRATRIPQTWSLHYLAATNLTAWGDKLWLDHQPEKALRTFMAARVRLTKGNGVAPHGFAVSDIQELQRKLESKIGFLEGAGIRLEEDSGTGGR